MISKVLTRGLLKLEACSQSVKRMVNSWDTTGLRNVIVEDERVSFIPSCACLNGR
jgi:hypothetical protein